MDIVRRSALVVASVVGLTGAAALATPAADGATAEAAIRTGTEVWIKAYNAGDADAIIALYALDAVVMPPGTSRASGHAAIRQVLVKEIAAAQAAGISLVLGSKSDVGVSGDLAWHAGSYSVVDKKTGATVDSGSYLETLRKVGDKWHIIRDIWNSDRPPATSAPTAAPAAGAK